MNSKNADDNEQDLDLEKLFAATRRFRGERNGTSFDVDQPGTVRRSARRHWLVAAAMLVVLAAAGIVWSNYRQDQLTPGAVPIIRADAGPVRVRPADAGGEDIPFQNQAVYDRLSPTASSEAPEKILPGAETPALAGQPQTASSENGAAPSVISPAAKADATANAMREATVNEPLLPPAGSAPQTQQTASSEPAQPGPLTVTSVPSADSTAASPPPLAAAPEAAEPTPGPLSFHVLTPIATVRPHIGAKAPAASAPTPASTPAPTPTSAPAAIAVAKPVPAPVAAPVAAAPAPVKIASASTPASIGSIIATTSSPAQKPPTQAAVPVAAPLAQAAPPVHSTPPMHLALPAEAGALRVQLASIPDRAQAQSVTADYRSRYAALLKGDELTPNRIELGAKGTYWRIQTQPMSRAAATELCTRLKAAGASCIVTHP